MEVNLFIYFFYNTFSRDSDIVGHNKIEKKVKRENNQIVINMIINIINNYYDIKYQLTTNKN